MDRSVTLSGAPTTSLCCARFATHWHEGCDSPRTMHARNAQQAMVVVATTIARPIVTAADVATTGLSVAADVYHLSVGDIDPREFRVRIGEKAAGLVGSSLGSKVGVVTALALWPTVGVVVLGGIAGSWIGGRQSRALVRRMFG